MRCDSCGVDIPPAWVKVIASNVCVECQGPIMSDGTIELMAGLKSALEQMPNDPQGIAGWLLSNYRMQKVGSGEPTGFIGIKSKPNQVNIEGVKLAGTPLERFQKLAGVKIEPPEKYKSLIAEINGGVLDEEQNDSEQAEYEGHVPEADDPEYTKKALSAMVAQPSKTKTPSRQAAHPDYDEEDLSDLHPSLHNDRLVRLQKQRDLDMGGVGIIKRG